MYLEVDETENEKHTLLLVAGGVEAPVGEELKRRDDELPRHGRRAILVSTGRRSAVLARLPCPWQHRSTDLRFVEVMVNPRKQPRTTSLLVRIFLRGPPGFDSLLFSPCTFIYTLTDGVWHFPSYFGTGEVVLSGTSPEKNNEDSDPMCSLGTVDLQHVEQEGSVKHGKRGLS